MTIILKIIKWASLVFLGLIFLAVISLEGFYYYKIYELRPEKIYSANQHPLVVKQALWVELNEVGDFGLEKLSATEYVVKMIYSLNRNNKLSSVQDFRLYSLKGAWLASSVARELQLKLAPDASQGQHHLNGLVLTVWLTRNVDVDDLIGYLLENMYLGNEVYGMKSAAKYYFGKTESELNTAEIISIISLLKSPSRFDPIRFPSRFKKRAGYFVERLKQNWPEKYADYQFSLPNFLER